MGRITRTVNVTQKNNPIRINVPAAICTMRRKMICVANAAEVGRLTSQGVTLRTDVLDFHARKLVFLSGPEGITVELAEWHPSSSSAIDSS